MPPVAGCGVGNCGRHRPRRVRLRPFAFTDSCAVVHIANGSRRARKFKYKGLWIRECGLGVAMREMPAEFRF
jgi:hypothetical protein